MTYYKSKRFVDRLKWVIVDEDGKVVNNNPNKDDLEGLEREPRYFRDTNRKYNETNTCDRCRELDIETKLYPQDAKRERNKDGKETGRWLCNKCYGKDYQKNNPNSQHNIIKLEADCRNNNLDPNSNAGIGYISAVLVGKFLGIEKDCYDISGNFNYPEYDMIEHEDWGLIDAKGSSLLTNNRGKLYHTFHTNKNKKVDFFFCIGFDKDRKHVIEVFIIPNEEDISKLGSVPIPYNGNSKYNIFKESEEEVKKWDDVFHMLKLDNCPVLRKDIK